MDSWKSLLIVFALCGLFAYLLINGIALLQIENNVNDSIITNPSLSSFNDSVYSNMDDLKDKSNDYKGAMENETQTEITPTGALTLGTIYHSITTFSGFIYSFATGLFSMLQNQLGVSPVIPMVFMAILIIVVILLFWRLYKWGQ
jgi:L-asparagine transporter-like permease